MGDEDGKRGEDRAGSDAAPGSDARGGDWAAEVGRGAFDPAFHAAAELVGRRWTGAIIRTLFHGQHRFREIAEAIPGISDRTLSARLKELSRHGIVGPGPEGRGYALTDKGRDLRLILIELARWANRWKDDAR